MNRLSEKVLEGTATRRLLRGDDEEIGPASHRDVFRRFSTALAFGSALSEGARHVNSPNIASLVVQIDRTPHARPSRPKTIALWAVMMARAHYPACHLRCPQCFRSPHRNPLRVFRSGRGFKDIRVIDLSPHCSFGVFPGQSIYKIDDDGTSAVLDR